MVTEMYARIKIDGPYATLHGIEEPADTLDSCLSILDPKRFYNGAFRAKRWDGKVRFHELNRFPAGLTSIVVEHLRDMGLDPSVKAVGGGKVDVKVERDVLRGVELWDHQFEAVKAIMGKARGYLEEPTGSGKTGVIAAAALYFWVEFGWRSLVLTSKKGIAVQTWRAVQEFVGEAADVGIVGDSMREDGDIVIGTAQTLQNANTRWVYRKEGRKKKRVRIAGQQDLRDIIASADVLFLDECHHASADTWYEIAMACPATRRYGLSGTATKKDEVLADRRMIAATGPLLHQTPATVLIDKGLAAKPKIAMVMSPNASGEMLPEVWDEAREKSVPMPYRDAYTAAMVRSREHNLTVVRATQWLIARGRKVLVMCRKKEHFTHLSEMFDARDMHIEKVWGATATEQRDRVKEQFSDGEIDGVLATTVWDEGEDVGGIDAIVLAEGVKVETSSVQRIGRGMRKDSEDVWVVDIVPVSHKKLMEHALKRCEAYEERGYEVMIVDDWPRMNSPVPDDMLPFESWDSAIAQLATAV